MILLLSPNPLLAQNNPIAHNIPYNDDVETVLVSRAQRKDFPDSIRRTQQTMAMREKDRKLRRKQRRQQKIRKLKTDLEEAKNLEERERIIYKIRRIHPWINLEQS
jgi:uncharacterized membrane protein YccC